LFLFIDKGLFFGGRTVKRVILAIVIVSIVSLIVAQSFAAEYRASRSTRRPVPRRYGPSALRDRADANSVFSEVKSLSDPNEVRTRIKTFEGLEKALDGVDRGSRNETRGWLQKRVINRPNLLKTVQSQIIAELSLIRERAEKEGAKETVAAIDGVLLDRQERFGRMTRKLQGSGAPMRRGDRRYMDDRGRNGRMDRRYRGRVPRGREEEYGRDTRRDSRYYRGRPREEDRSEEDEEMDY
jgi:hypothetical protein